MEMKNSIDKEVHIQNVIPSSRYSLTSKSIFSFQYTLVFLLVYFRISGVGHFLFLDGCPFPFYAHVQNLI